jgi:hypothetical protein
MIREDAILSRREGRVMARWVWGSIEREWDKISLISFFFLLSSVLMAKLGGRVAAFF